MYKQTPAPHHVRVAPSRLEHQELADLIGANREAVSATLIKLRRSKCVNSVHGFLVLANEELLKTNVAKDAAA